MHKYRKPRQAWAWAGALATVAAVAAVAAWAYKAHKARARDTLPARMAQIVPLAAAAALPCEQLMSQRPWVLLALGQSNAGNHGQPSLGQAAPPPIGVFTQGQCAMAQEPLPGATGSGASVWSRLAQALAAQPVATADAPAAPRPLLIINVAVDASSSAEWVAKASPLRQRLLDTLADVKRQALPVHAVLWQQGEADARQAVDAGAYQRNLIALRQLLVEQGIQAPMLLAKSTVCRSLPDRNLRGAVESLTAGLGGVKGFAAGPDTDTLVDGPQASLAAPATQSSLPVPGTMRFDGCHFGPQGLAEAARLWAQALRPLLSQVP